MKLKVNQKSQAKADMPVITMPQDHVSPDYVDTQGEPQSVTAMVDGICEAEEIDRGIRDTINGIRVSILAMGLGLAKIKSQGLYKDLGFQSMARYIQRLCDDTKMDHSSIYNWLYIGEAYIKYQNDLEQIGFNDSDGPTKLPYLERALVTNEKQNVFDNIKKMTLRDFIAFAKTKEGANVPSGNDKPVATERGNSFFIDGNLAIIVSKKLGRRTSSYFKKVIRVACKALEEGEVIQPVRLHDRREARREARRFAPAAERLKMKLRKKTST